MIVIPNRVRVVVVVSALALAAGLLTLALLEKPAQAQAETITDNYRSTFNEPWTSCTGEVVRIRGTLHIVGHLTTDENGVRHYKAHADTRGQGESASGAKYVFHLVGNIHHTFRNADNLSDGVTHTQTVKLIRQGSATPTDDLESRTLIHITLNDQGEITAAFFKAEGGECT